MLASDPAAAISQLTGILNATNSVSVWVNTLLNAVIPPMSPPPAWYDRINSALQASQQHSQPWASDTARKIISDFTGSFIAFSDDFSTAVGFAQPLLEVIRQQGNLPTAGQVSELVQIFGPLQTEAAQHQATVRTHLKSMKDYRAQMEKDYAALKTAIKAALPEEAADKAAVQQIQTQIQSIETALAADGATATAATVDTNSAMTSVVIGLTFASEFDPVAFGIGLIFLGVDIVIDAETQAQVISDLKQIQTLSAQLTQDQVQLGLIQGVVSNLESLADGIESSLITFDDFDDTWTLANLSLSYLLVVLAQPKIDISKIPDLNDLAAAAAAWAQVAAFAQKVQNSELTAHAPIIIAAPAA